MRNNKFLLALIACLLMFIPIVSASSDTDNILYETENVLIDTINRKYGYTTQELVDKGIINSIETDNLSTEELKFNIERLKTFINKTDILNGTDNSPVCNNVAPILSLVIMIVATIMFIKLLTEDNDKDNDNINYKDLEADYVQEEKPVYENESAVKFEWERVDRNKESKEEDK